MSKKYYIKPSEDKASFCALFKDDPEISSDLVPQSLQINAIKIDSDSNWTFHLNEKYIISDELKMSLKKILPEAREIYFMSPELLISQEDRKFSPVDNWEEITTELAVVLPTMNGFLSVKNLKFEEDILEIQLPSTVHSNLLKDKGCQDLIAQILKRRMGRAIKVNFSTFKVTDEDLEIEFPDISQEIFVDETPKVSDKFSKKRKSKKEPEEGALKGRRISGDASPIDELEEGDRGVILSGFIFHVDERELKNGSWLHNFSICDTKDSVNCKFLRYAEDPVVSLKLNQWIKVRGDYQYDQFARESVLMVKDIEEAGIPPIREDNAEKKRVELHLHTKMSAMDAISSTDELIKRASFWGHKACAITDHGVVQSFPDAFAAAKNHGIKPLFGVEGYLTDVERKEEDAPTYHICILVKNLAGLRRLYTLVSRSHSENFKRHPRISRTWLKENREGLIIGSACEAGELYRAVVNGKSDAELKHIASFYDYLEIMPVGNNEFMVRSNVVENLDGIREHNKKIYNLGKELGITVVATGDVHFLDPQDAIYREVLMAGQGYDDFNLQAPLYFKTTDEMLEEFSYLGESEAFEVVVENPNFIADSIENLMPVPDELATPHIDGAEEEIREMALKKAKNIYGDSLPEIVSARLERELGCIIDNGYAVIYLIAHKLVKKSLEDGYVVGSRGSVGSSLVATMCDITEVNPLTPHYVCPLCKYSDFTNETEVLSGYDLPDRNCPDCGTQLKKDGHDIPFEVFMGFEGDKNPDIDLNFSGEYQSKIHKYAEEIFGVDNVFRAGTISTIAEKTAYGFAKAYAEKKGKNIGHAELSRLAKGCTGVKRTTGQHPGGIIVVPKTDSIFRFTPVQHPANDGDSGVRTTHFDYKSIHDNLLKLDLLGHDDPTCIRMLEDITLVKASDIPMDDPETMAIFSGSSSLNLTGCDLDEIGTVAIPEFGTKFVRGMLRDTRPKTFAELVQISGLSHGTDVWLNNAQDLITNNTAALSQVITVRDDIMTYLIRNNLPPKTSFKIMEQVRKGKGLTAEDEKLMNECSVPQWYIESCKKIKYMFPKAHAVAYVMMAFRIAYYKLHHPKAFYATYFHICREAFDPGFASLSREEAEAKYQELLNKNDLSAKEKDSISTLEVVIEAIIRGIKFLPVDLMKSSTDKFLIEGEGLRLPFVVISGLGDAVANSLVEARALGEFSSIENLKNRTKLSKSHIESMRSMGILDGMQETDQLSLF